MFVFPIDLSWHFTQTVWKLHKPDRVATIIDFVPVSNLELVFYLTDEGNPGQHTEKMKKHNTGMTKN